ncbi:MAG: tyrosine-type recombinase/integrase [Clostridium sp.]|jgi:integrase|nr:tyrosine-type recombinase/integrase [Clostridium sp.]
MKHPNGYGSVVKLGGKRRRPFCARKTDGYDERGFPIYRPIGYYAKREEALMALAEYNRNPYDIDLARITMQELYDRWSVRDFPKMSRSSSSSHKAALKHCAALLSLPYKSIKAYQMQEMIDGCGCGYSTQGAIKNLFGKLDLYAMELDVIAKKNSELIHAAPIPPTSKEPFNKEEIETVWAHQHEPYADTVLILIYSGFRINELLSIETADVNLEENWIKGGLKTKAGRDRVVPIHSLILDIVKKRVREGSKYLVSLNGKRVSQSQYYTFWNAFMESNGLDHTPHECRHTFRSLLDSAGANKKCIDLMMGHTSKDVGERIYTHKTLQELAEALALVTR